jgi:putative ABC transport system permease protein
MPLNYDINQLNRNMLLKKLTQSQNVEAASSRVVFTGLISTYNESTSVRVVGVESMNELNVCPGLRTRIIGKNVSNGLVGKNGVIVTYQLAKAMKIKLGDSIVIVGTNKNGSVNALNLKVEGFFHNTQRIVFMNIEDVYTLMRLDSIIEIVIRVKDFDKLDKVKTELQKIINDPGYTVSLWSDISPFATIASVIDLMYIFLVVLVVAIIIVSIMNVMLMAVYERTKEIGTLLAIGTKPSDIMLMFYIESAFMGLFSAIAGSALGMAIIGILRAFKPRIRFRDIAIQIIPSISFYDILFILVIVVFFTIVATIIPARKAKKLNPIDALRHN